MAAGAAIHVTGWWSGYKIGGIIALFSADFLQNAGFENYWQLTFIGLGGLVILANIGLLFIPEASANARIEAQNKAEADIVKKLGTNNHFARFIGFLGSTVWGPLASFFRQNGVAIGLGILSFVLLFKIGEAFMGKMSLIFYSEIGFSKSDIALYSKGLGWIPPLPLPFLAGFLPFGQVRFAPCSLLALQWRQPMSCSVFLPGQVNLNGCLRWQFCLMILLLHLPLLRL